MKKTDFKSDLDLLALTGARSNDLIHFCWKDYSFSETTTPLSVDLSHLSLQTALHVIYPELSYLQVLSLEFLAEKYQMPLDLPELYRLYGFQYNENLKKLNETLKKVSSSFFQWSQKHSLAPKELQPLLSLPQLDPINPQLEELAKKNPSRNLGAQILDLLVECLLMGVAEQKLFTAGWNPDTWLLELKKLRYPQTTQRDLLRQNEISSLPWTKELRSRWLRVGDRSGVEVKFLVSNKNDLQLRIQELQRVYESYNDDSTAQ